MIMFCELRGTHYTEYLEVDGKIILKRMWTAMIWLRIGTGDRLLQTHS
jgi:hypothetical protein